MEPLGLALENFDATGVWRRKDNEMPVDSLGELYDGSQMDGAAGVRQALLKHADMILRNFTAHLLSYGTGRRVEYFDMPTVRAIVAAAEKQDYRLSAIIMGIVRSAAFQETTASEPVQNVATIAR
jgi:hypothetical protein